MMSGTSAGKIVTAIATSAITLLMAVSPVLADTERGHAGTVGKHSLQDELGSPGATCRYTTVSLYDNDLKLRRIVVRPPLMRAVEGKSAQTVGWTFTVQRRVQGIGGATEWVNRYTSSEATAVTDDAHDASFTKASVPVRPGGNLAGGVYQYRVLVTMLWHRADGSLQGTARHRVDYYTRRSDIGLTDVRVGKCDAFWYQPDV
jgi:hypothetical protein